MAKNDKKPFVFNDQSETNSYGFSIPTRGISLKRFLKNPVMLDSHWNSTHSVLGSWENVKKTKEGLLLGEPVFDTEDADTDKVAGKVERGVIKACSMGISFKREDLKHIKGVLSLVKCELYEVSIVAIPSNANSIRLYVDGSDKPMTEEEVQSLCLSVIEVENFELINTQNKSNQNMKIKLEAAVCTLLGLPVGTEMEQSELQAKLLALGLDIATLKTEKTAVELQLSTLKTANETAKLEAIKTEVKLAKDAGKITADKEQDFVDLGIANPELLTSTLAALPTKKSLGAQIKGGESDTEVKTPEDFQKLSLEQQLAFKAEQPEAYKSLFTNKN